MNFSGMKSLDLCNAVMRKQNELKLLNAFYDYCKSVPQACICARPKRGGRYAHVSCDLLSLPGTYSLTEEAKRAIWALWNSIPKPLSVRLHWGNSPNVSTISFHPYVPRARVEAVLERLVEIVSNGVKKWERDRTI